VATDEFAPRIRGPAGSLLAIVIFAVSTPVVGSPQTVCAFGLKVTDSWHVAFGARAVTQPLVMKSALSDVTLEMVTVMVGDVLVTVTTTGALVVPAICFGNAGAVLSAVSRAAGGCCCGFG
jgi:hypothetical protein